MNKRQIALISGWSLILMAIIAGFSVGYAFSEFNKPDQASSLKDIILSNQGLYLSMLIGIFLILLLDVLVSYTLYRYFMDDSRKISLASGLLRMIYTLIFGIATFYLVENFKINGIQNQSINANFQSFQTIWSGGLVIFGFHIILIGYLMKLHQRIPKILWYLTLIAGVSYIAVHTLKFTNPGAGFVSTLEMILSLPMAIGELGLAIWLIISGGKDGELLKKSAAENV